MDQKRYEDYHVLDEELEVDNDINDINDINEEIIDVEIVDGQDKKSSYTSVLQDIEEEEIKEANTVSYTEIEINEEKVLEQDINESAQIIMYQSAFKKENEQEQYEDISQTFTNQKARDTSFSSYVEADRKRERSFLVKWSIRLAKFILFVMLLPVICIIGGGLICIAGGITAGVLGCIFGGLFIVGLTCFIASQVSTTIVALGISTGVLAISFGGIVLILCMMFIKELNKVINRRKVDKKKEVR